MTKDPVKLKEKPEKDFGSFGWDFFVLKTPENKIRYMFSQIFDFLCRRSKITWPSPEHVIENEKRKIHEKVFLFFLARYPKYTNQLPAFSAHNNYVDHQSQFCFPEYADGTLNWNFCQAFIDFILRDDITILGGNDNEYSPKSWNKYSDDVIYLFKFMTDTRTKFRARFDVNNNTWVIYDRKTGQKVSINFKEIA
jgi:hypothetical protein